jgi:hypothetical protein
MEDAPIRVTNVKARIGGVIYWLFAATALLLIATSAPNNRLGLESDSNWSSNATALISWGNLVPSWRSGGGQTA